MIESKVQMFLNHCINVIKADKVSHTVADGEQRWNEYAELGGVTMYADYSDRDYLMDNNVSISYVVGKEYSFKVPLAKFLTMTRVDIIDIAADAASHNVHYTKMLDDLKKYTKDVKAYFQQKYR